MIDLYRYDKCFLPKEFQKKWEGGTAKRMRKVFEQEGYSILGADKPCWSEGRVHLEHPETNSEFVVFYNGFCYQKLPYSTVIPRRATR